MVLFVPKHPNNGLREALMYPFGLWGDRATHQVFKQAPLPLDGQIQFLMKEGKKYSQSLFATGQVMSK